MHQRRRDAFARCEPRRHAVGRHNRHRCPVRHELLHGDAGAVKMRAAVGPIVHDVVVVRNLDVVEIDGAELGHLRNEEIGEAFPARASRVSRATLALEEVPLPCPVGRDHELRIDPREREASPSRRRASALGPQRLPNQRRAGGDAGSGLEEVPPRGTGWLPARFAHGVLPLVGQDSPIRPPATVFCCASRADRP
jgi:hypothetical protein